MLQKSANLTEHRCCAKYIPTPDRGLVLYQIQEFSAPVFRDEGWEGERHPPKATKISGGIESKRQALSRARRNVFDICLADYTLDAFVTLTYAPKEGFDRTSYKDVYHPLRIFLSNRVQRNGLRYVMVSERHKAGGIHFHALCNSSALTLRQAINPHTGETIFQNNQAVYNVCDWDKMGFSTCKLIEGETLDRVKVAKYISKYITKDSEKIGGRYFYHGGQLLLPVRVLGDSVEEFAHGEPVREYHTEIEGRGKYSEYVFL